MKTLFVCHEDATLRRECIPRWLASFSDVIGIIVLQERGQRKWKRIRREIKRSGLLGFLDVGLFRFYYKFFWAKKDQQWTEQKIEELCKRFDPLKEGVPQLVTHSINSPEAKAFIEENTPDVMLVMCKQIIKEEVFSIPRTGTFVMHPGICPEYRNAHGCFWALAKDDLDNVGMTMLKIDKGVDTGPIYGYYRYNYDEVNESHTVIQFRVIFDNLDALADKLTEIAKGEAESIDTTGRSSATWGQPRLTSYLKWKFRARRRNR